MTECRFERENTIYSYSIVLVIDLVLSVYCISQDAVSSRS